MHSMSAVSNHTTVGAAGHSMRMYLDKQEADVPTGWLSTRLLLIAAVVIGALLLLFVSVVFAERE